VLHLQTEVGRHCLHTIDRFSRRSEVNTG
jgi:hypothetical protein